MTTLAEESSALSTVANSLVSAMGPEWRAVENDCSWYRVLTRETDDGHLYAINVHSGRGKLTISGTYPTLPNNESVTDCIKKYGESLPSIGASASKSPAQIAADIKRRLIPLYEEKRTLAIAAIARTMAYRKSMDESAAQLGKVLGVEPYRRDDKSNYTFSTSHFADGYGDITVSNGDSVTMDLRSIPLALAMKVAAVLVKWSENHPRE